MTLERPPRRISTVRVRPTDGLGARRRRRRSPRRDRSRRAARRSPPAPGQPARSGTSVGVADVAARRRCGRGRRAVAEVAQDRLAPAAVVALDEGPHRRGTGASARARPRRPRCGTCASARPSKARSERGRARGPGATGAGWITPGPREVADQRAAAARRRSRPCRPARGRRRRSGRRRARICSAVASRPKRPRRAAARSMKNTCRPLSRFSAKSRQRAGCAVAARRGRPPGSRPRPTPGTVAWHDRPHVGLVHAHPERVGGHDDRHLAGHEAALRLRALGPGQARRGRRAPPRPSSRATARAASASAPARVPA